MDKSKNLNSYIHEKIYPELTYLEDMRQLTVSKIIKTLSIYTAIILLIIIFVFKSDNARIWTAVIGGIIGIAIYMMLIDNYVKEFKERVVKKNISFFGHQLNYAPESGIGEGIFNKSSIFTQRPTSYSCEDHIYGKVDKTSMAFSEVSASVKTGRNSSRTIFSGLFMFADFNKNFSGKTIILPDMAEKIFGESGAFLQGFNKSRGELVKLENPDFEREFVVYSDDQIQSRYILTPSLIEKILDFKLRAGKKIYMSFVDSRIYIAIPEHKNLFEPTVFYPVDDLSMIYELYNILDLIINVIEDLDLNTRLWAKE